MRGVLFAAIAASIPLARAHIAFYDPSMWGYYVRAEDYPYDNRPETPLQEYTFGQWWFHNHLAHPPAPNTFFELPAGGTAVSQLACNKGATKWWADSEGTTDIRQGDYPCPGSPTSAFHTTGHDDLKGCALSIAYTSDVNSIKPEDLAVFSVNHECVWNVNTPFQVPKDMPPCPDGGCICAWHWIHSVDSGSAQMYMNGFRCKVTGSTSSTPVLKPEVPKRCTGDLAKCNQGAQQPLYWFQKEGNNMNNDQYDPPYYLDEWGFTNGAQNKIFGSTTLPVDNKSTSSLADTPSSTPAESQPPSTPVDNKPTPTPTDNKPPSTPVDSNPTSTPVDNNPTSTPVEKPSTPAESKPPSTPVDNRPTPTPGNPPKDNYTPTDGGGDDCGDPEKPPPSPSSSPAPSQASPPSPPPVKNNGAGPAPSPTNPPPKPQGDSEVNTTSNHLPSPSKKPRCRKRGDKKVKKRQEVVPRRFKRHFARQHSH